MDIRIENLCKRFGNTHALDQVNLSLQSGELVALLGPSGSGKTTLLRSIAGLEFPDSGRILFNGNDALHLTVQQRRIGFVFQHYALFAHMNVLDNVAFGLRCKPRRERMSRAAMREHAQALLDTVQLSELGQRYPHQLSGGQRQRVALARAMAIDPTLLLLDEPFGALDAKVRGELRAWLRRIHDETGYTTLFVTHDQEEAIELADRIVVFNQGHIEQVGTPDEVYDQPCNAFVFDFLGRGNRIHGEFSPDGFIPRGSSLRLPARHAAGEGHILVRPHDYSLADAGQGLNGRVRSRRRIGGRITLELEVEHQPGLIELDLPYDLGPSAPQNGEHIGVVPTRYHVLD